MLIKFYGLPLLLCLMGWCMLGCNRPAALFLPTGQAQAHQLERSLSITESQPGAQHTLQERPGFAGSWPAVGDSTGALEARLSAGYTSLHRRQWTTKHHAPPAIAVTAPQDSRTLNLVQKLVLKRLNHQIRRHLAPAHPERTLAQRLLLVLGGGLVLAGILLFALTTGAGAFVGAIAAAVGLVLILVDLF